MKAKERLQGLLTPEFHAHLMAKLRTPRVGRMTGARGPRIDQLSDQIVRGSFLEDERLDVVLEEGRLEADIERYKLAA